MELSSVHVHRSPIDQAVILFCFVWPFIALALMRSRVRSPSPVAAMLAPLALSTTMIWFGLVNSKMGMDVSASRGAALAAGIAEALSSLYFGGWSAVFVAVIALVRRHRPVVDRVTAAIACAVIANIAAAIIGGQRIISLSFGVAVSGAATGVIAASVAIAWCVLHKRGDRATHVLRFGLPLFLALAVVTGAVVWQQVQHYIAIAIGR